MDRDETQDQGDGAQPGTTRRESFDATELVVHGETAAASVAAQAQAAVQARYIVAMQRPRDMDDVRVKLLKECSRSSFAEVARYHKPIGEGVDGLSIRFAEAALMAMGNVLVQSPAIYDDAHKRILRVTVMDLESNTTFEKDVTVAKTVERRKLAKEQIPISSRFNSRNQRVYLVQATDDDILNKENALVSKAIRTEGLRLVPGDLKEECELLLIETKKAEIKKDPDAERKRLADAFAALNVDPSELKTYLGHDLAGSSPEELLDLRVLYSSIRDAETTWAEVLESKLGASAGNGEAEPDPKNEELQRKLADRRARMKRGESPAGAAPPATGDGDDPGPAAAKGEAAKPKASAVKASTKKCPGCDRTKQIVETSGHHIECPYREAGKKLPTQEEIDAVSAGAAG